MTTVLFSGAWGKKIHKKPEAKNLVTLSLSVGVPPDIRKCLQKLAVQDLDSIQTEGGGS
jgi:hypothetical protein